MAKTLLVMTPLLTAGGTTYIPLISGGGMTYAATEGNVDSILEQACTASNLRTSLITYVSGTLTFDIRVATADGNETTSHTATGFQEDTTNTDSVSASNVVGVRLTNSGIAAIPGTLSVILDWASGTAMQHGGYYGTGRTFIAGYYPISGVPTQQSTEAQAEWKNRAYTSWESIRQRVTANTNATDQVVTNRINGAAGSGTYTIPGSTTGLFTSTGLGDALADGDLINFLATGAGIGTRTSPYLTAFFTGTVSCDTINGSSSSGEARTASATAHYFPLAGENATLTRYTEANARIKPGYVCNLSNLRINLKANTYTADATLKLIKNGTAASTVTITASGGAGWYENTSDTIACSATDEFSYEIVGGTSGSITIMQMGVTLTLPFTPKVNVSGVWKDVTSAHVNVSSVWKKINEAWVKVSGVWKQVQ